MRGPSEYVEILRGRKLPPTRTPLTQPENNAERDKIDDFQRKPSELRRYRQFTYELVRDYGSITDFMQKQRLKWDLLDPEESTPFANPADLKILCNDWPYGVDERIAHLVVWVKFELPEDPETGRLYPHVRRQIDEYVKETFGPHVRDEHVSGLISRVVTSAPNAPTFRSRARFPKRAREVNVSGSSSGSETGPASSRCTRSSTSTSCSSTRTRSSSRRLRTGTSHSQPECL